MDALNWGVVLRDPDVHDRRTSAGRLGGQVEKGRYLPVASSDRRIATAAAWKTSLGLPAECLAGSLVEFVDDGSPPVPGAGPVCYRSESDDCEDLAVAGHEWSVGASAAEEERFTALFQRHHDAVLRYAQRRAGDLTADDVTAEVFLAAWRRLDDLPGEPLPWLIGAARRVLANQRRGQDRLEALRLRLSSESAAPSTALGEQVNVTAVWSAALGRLSGADQEVLALLAWDGLTAREAAASLGCTEAAFAMRLHRARRRLSRHLLDADPEITFSHRDGNDAVPPAPAPAERTTP